MSATLMGAVFDCGPADRTMAFVLLAIAENADDYGFACPSIETIAAKGRCDERTAMRMSKALEMEGWMVVHRRALFRGKGNAYFLNLAKLGVTLSPKARKSPLHADYEQILGDRKSRDNVSPVKPVQRPVDTAVLQETSGDNPQARQVTKPTFSGDKTAQTNKEEPLGTVVEPKASPLPPSRGVEDHDGGVSEDEPLDLRRELAKLGRHMSPDQKDRAGVSGLVYARASFNGVTEDLRHALYDTALANVHKRKPGMLDGAEEYKRYFADVTLEDYEAAEGTSEQIVLVLRTRDPAVTRKGFTIYRGRIERAMVKYFGRVVQVRFQEG